MRACSTVNPSTQTDTHMGTKLHPHHSSGGASLIGSLRCQYVNPNVTVEHGMLNVTVER